MTKAAAWRVRIEAHDLPPRFAVQACEGTVYAATEDQARRDAVRNAHVRDGIPALRSMAKASLAHATALPVGPKPWELPL